MVDEVIQMRYFLLKIICLVPQETRMGSKGLAKKVKMAVLHVLWKMFIEMTN